MHLLLKPSMELILCLWVVRMMVQLEESHILNFIMLVNQLLLEDIPFISINAEIYNQVILKETQFINLLLGLSLSMELDSYKYVKMLDMIFLVIIISLKMEVNPKMLSNIIWEWIQNKFGHWYQLMLLQLPIGLLTLTISWDITMLREVNFMVSGMNWDLILLDLPLILIYVLKVFHLPNLMIT